MEKDITTNDFIANNDVFADIANVNLFAGKRVIAPEDLESVPTDSSYKDLEGQHHILFRDMGYAYSSYAGQIQKIVARNRRQKNSAYSKVIHDYQRLIPVATFILYFGSERWEKPLSLLDILNIPENKKNFWKNLINDYKIKVIHVSDQPEELRKKYQSDFGIIADYLSFGKNYRERDKHLRANTRKLIHVEQVLDMLKALSGDKRFEKIKESFLERENKEECDTMCSLLDMCEEEGIKKGIEIGNISIIRKMRGRGYTIKVIADIVDRKEEDISQISTILEEHPDWAEEKIYQRLQEMEKGDCHD